MAKRVVNRKVEMLPEGADVAADAAAAAAKPKAKKATKKKAAAEVRMKLYWGVFSQNLKRVAVFEFDQKDEADKRADELSKGGKQPHFVQKVKEQVAET
jgi:hypothetical protein